MKTNRDLILTSEDVELPEINKDNTNLIKETLYDILYTKIEVDKIPYSEQQFLRDVRETLNLEIYKVSNFEETDLYKDLRLIYRYYLDRIIEASAVKEVLKSCNYSSVEALTSTNKSYPTIMRFKEKNALIIKFADNLRMKYKSKIEAMFKDYLFSSRAKATRQINEAEENAENIAAAALASELVTLEENFKYLENQINEIKKICKTSNEVSSSVIMKILEKKKVIKKETK